MAIYITSFIVFITATGILLYQGTKKTVALTLDGKEQIVSTHATTIEDLLNELDIPVSQKDYLHPAGDTKIEKETKVTWRPAKEITFEDGNGTKEIMTTSNTVGEFLKEQKIPLRDEDKIVPSVDAKLENEMNIEIDRAFQLHVVDGGVPKKVWSTSATVADFLKQQGIDMQTLDRVEPSLETPIKPNSVVNVVRVQKVTDVVEEPVKYKVISQKDSSLPKGKEKVITEGKEGLVSNQYEIITENGKEIKRTVVDSKVLRASTDQVVAVGTKAINDTASRGEVAGGREMTVTATAYTAYCNGCSGRTATGFDLRSNPNAKIIAVDPRVIPLGTKVYVEGYGYAVAADTGGAIKGNKIDIFFSSKSKAYQWGRKQVKIRILD